MASLGNQSNFTAINNLGMSPVNPVIGQNFARTSITFHAPGAIDIYVAPTQILSGGVNANLTPSLSSLGGCFHIFAGGTLTIAGPAAAQAWQAFAASVSNQPLTIVEGFA